MVVYQGLAETGEKRPPACANRGTFGAVWPIFPCCNLYRLPAPVLQILSATKRAVTSSHLGLVLLTACAASMILVGAAILWWR
jgi:hypothetical protein